MWQACILNGAAQDASDKRCAKINALVDSVVGAVYSSQFGKAVLMVERRLKPMAEEGTSTPIKIYNAEFDASHACKFGLKNKEARIWLQKAHMHCVMLVGDDSPCTEKTARLLAQPVNAMFNPLDV